jgi:hypothetical protein
MITPVPNTTSTKYAAVNRRFLGARPNKSIAPTIQYKPALRISEEVTAVVLTVRVLLTVPLLETCTWAGSREHVGGSLGVPFP